MNKDQIKSWVRNSLGSKKKKILLAALGIGAAVVVITGGMAISDIAGWGKGISVLTSATLEKIIDIDELSTYEAVYDGICTVMNEKKPEKVDYYVSYKAKVKAGIDFEKVKIEIDHKEKRIQITLPEIKMNEVSVDVASLDFIFNNKKANDEDVSQEAYQKCKEDVEKESKEDQAIYEMAEQNAENTIKALIKPFIEQVDAEYRLELI